MYINLVLYYYHVHWSSTVLLARRWVNYCIFALYIKNRRRLRRSGRDAQPPTPSSSLLSQSWRSQQRRHRWCGILLAAAAASVASEIAPPSLPAEASLSVAVDTFLPPPSSSADLYPGEPQRLSFVPSLPSEYLVSPRLWRRIGRRRRKREGFGLFLPSFLRRIWRRCRRRNEEIG